MIFRNENVTKITFILLNNIIASGFILIASGFILKRFHLIIITSIFITYTLTVSIIVNDNLLWRVISVSLMILIVNTILLYYFVGLFHKLVNKLITQKKEMEISEKRYRLLFSKMLNGFTYNKVITDEDNKPVDYVVLDVNESFENYLGVKKEKTVGRNIKDIYPNINEMTPNFIETFGNIGLNGGEKKMEFYFSPKDRWYSSLIYSPEKGYFAVLFEDITKRKIAEEKLKASLREKNALIREVHHRVKNNLQILMSILRLQSNNTMNEVIEYELKKYLDRIKSIALVYEELYNSEDLSKIDFVKYIRELCNSLIDFYGYNKDNIIVNTERTLKNINMDVDKAIKTGLIANELIMNSLNHAFTNKNKDNSENKINIDFYYNKEHKLVLSISDNGIGLPNNFDNAQTLGFKLIKTLIKQIKAQYKMTCDNGTTFEIIFP